MRDEGCGMDSASVREEGNGYRVDDTAPLSVRDGKAFLAEA